MKSLKQTLNEKLNESQVKLDVTPYEKFGFNFDINTGGAFHTIESELGLITMIIRAKDPSEYIKDEALYLVVGEEGIDPGITLYGKDNILRFLKDQLPKILKAKHPRDADAAINDKKYKWIAESAKEEVDEEEELNEGKNEMSLQRFSNLENPLLPGADYPGFGHIKSIELLDKKGSKCKVTFFDMKDVVTLIWSKTDGFWLQD